MQREISRRWHGWQGVGIEQGTEVPGKTLSKTPGRRVHSSNSNRGIFWLTVYLFILMVNHLDNHIDK